MWRLPRLLKALAGRRVTAHVLTHAHPDHQGASAALCSARSVPLRCGVRDLEATERATFADRFHGPRRPLFKAAEWLGGPGHPVEGTLREGDAVADFEVIETPGHTPGHISLWRESDRVIVLRPRLVCFGHGPPLADRRPVRPLGAAL
ncbi:MAG: MBL fold metallo-hydrolase [Trueperaceae bacterium]|nr:MBL fold metallo-hydrolase [Trueperaceae bacterium]